MIKKIARLVLFLNALIVFGQTENNPEIIKADSTWSKETLQMPLGFAREINYEGLEDIRFAEGWAKKERPDFWTYVFAWHIKGIQKQTVENLERHLKLYFDGLMLPPNYKEQNISESTILFIENPNDNNSFIGKIKTYDRFHTKEIIALNCTVKSYYCETKNTSTIVFRFSLQDFDNDVWMQLKKVTISDEVCKY